MKRFLMLLGLLGLSSPGNATDFFDLPVLQTNPQPGHSQIPNDINGDGTSDLLWFNPRTNQFGYWLITLDSNGKFHRGTIRTMDVTPGYLVGALGDFNKDGRTDVIWTSDHHDLYLWTSNGTGFRSSLLGTYPAGWKLLGAGDVDGDGFPDLLWWNASSNQFGYWLMPKGKPATKRTFNVTPGYELVAIGYSRPRTRLSLIWLNADGEVYDWDSNGAGFRSYRVGNFARPDVRQIEFVRFGVDNEDPYFVITDPAGNVEDDYSWIRQFDANGNQTSGYLLGGLWGGWGQLHLSGQIYYRWHGGTSGPVDVVTDRIGDAGYPQALSIFSIYEPYNHSVSGWADIYTGFPVDWYLIGEPWYRSDRIQYGPAPTE